MEEKQQILEGKGTYIAAAVGIIVAALIAAGVVTPDARTDQGEVVEIVGAIVAGIVSLIGIFQRRATARVEKKMDAISHGQEALVRRITPPYQK